jgi:hypothetical protein
MNKSIILNGWMVGWMFSSLLKRLLCSNTLILFPTAQLQEPNPHPPSTHLINHALKINHHDPLMHALRHPLQRLVRLTFIIIKLHIFFRREHREDRYSVPLSALVWEGVSCVYGEDVRLSVLRIATC